jgi:hypothetical protein
MVKLNMYSVINGEILLPPRGKGSTRYEVQGIKGGDYGKIHIPANKTLYVVGWNKLNSFTYIVSCLV